MMRGTYDFLPRPPRTDAVSWEPFAVLDGGLSLSRSDPSWKPRVQPVSNESYHSVSLM